MFKFLIHCLNRHLYQKRICAELKKRGVEMHLPFDDFDIRNLITDAPVYIGPNASLQLRGKLYIGAGSIIGPRFKVHTSNHRWRGEMLPYDDVYEVKNVRIGANVWIGADVSIMAGVEIGEGAIVAACACVTKNVPPMALVGGCPARIIAYRDAEIYQRLKEEGKIYLSMKAAGKTRIQDEERCIIVKE